MRRPPRIDALAGHAPRAKHRRRVPGAVVGVALLVLIGDPPASAHPRPGSTELVSAGLGGEPASGTARLGISMSAAGRFVAFVSTATNLVEGETGGGWQVFLHDRETGGTEWVSQASDGTPLGTQSLNPSVSGDGRFVVFDAFAAVPVPNPHGDPFLRNVFVRDRAAGTTEQVSLTSEGGLPNNYSNNAAISADGRYVAFRSLASNLVPGDTNETFDVFVRDLQMGTTERVSVATDGTEGNDSSGTLYATPSSISADGRYVAFHSLASNLVQGDTNESADVFVRDRVAETTERVSINSDGEQGNHNSVRPSISADGRYVAFDSTASNLVPGDGDEMGGLIPFASWMEMDVYVHDRGTGDTERVSVTSHGVEGSTSKNSRQPSISADGRYVAFSSVAPNLVADKTTDCDAPVDQSCEDIFVHDRMAGTTERVSVAMDDTDGNGQSSHAAISADGRYVAFHSLASNLVPGDTNGFADVFVRHRGTDVGVGDLLAASNEGDLTVSGWARLSGMVISSAQDLEGQTASFAATVGAELVAASLTYRPEEEDLLVRLRLVSLPALYDEQASISGGAGLPGMTYTLALGVEASRYEVRALRATTSTPHPHFALYRCEATCTEVVPLLGGIGTTGTEVRMSVPLAALGIEEGANLTSIEAFTAVGETTPGALIVLDEMALPDAVIPVSTVELGIAPAGAPEESVSFPVRAELVEGTFSGSLDVGSLPAVEHRVWARACLGDVCGTASRPVTLK